MHFGDLVTMLPDGMRVAPKELEPIGLFDGSTAWGTWFSDVRARGDVKKRPRPEHFVFSPFEVSSWPVLVRIELKLDEHIGALRDATAVLREHGLNILAIDVTPTGHHHSTANIIGEALSIKHGQTTLLEEASRWKAGQRHFRNDDIWHYACSRIAPAVLRYTSELAARILQNNRDIVASGEHGFLRQTFADPDYRLRGVLFDPAGLERELGEAGKRQAQTAVTCSWLQELAYFWLYRNPDEPVVPLLFDAQACKLQVGASAVAAFQEHMGSQRPPFVAIAAINAYEQYTRIVLSERDHWERTVRVNVPYVATFTTPGQTSLGLQNHLFASLAHDGINVGKVSIATRESSSERERSELSILVTLPGAPHQIDARINALRDAVVRSTEGFPSCKVRCVNPPGVERLYARRMFLSTRYDWLSLSDKRYKNLVNLAAYFGFEVVDARTPERVSGLRWNQDETIAENSIRMIVHCDAFLQVIPIAAEGNLEWLMFESGAARAARLPLAICVECVSSVDRLLERTVSSWQMALKVSAGTRLFDFEAGDKRDLAAALKRALETLQIAPARTRGA